MKPLEDMPPEPNGLPASQKYKKAKAKVLVEYRYTGNRPPWMRWYGSEDEYRAWHKFGHYRTMAIAEKAVFDDERKYHSLQVPGAPRPIVRDEREFRYSEVK